jgi:hypothetical protein
VHPLCFYKHKHDIPVHFKLFVACQRWWFQWRFCFVPKVPGNLRAEEEHKKMRISWSIVATTYSYLMCTFYDKLLKPRQSFRITLYIYIYTYINRVHNSSKNFIIKDKKIIMVKYLRPLQFKNTNFEAITTRGISLFFFSSSGCHYWQKQRDKRFNLKKAWTVLINWSVLKSQTLWRRKKPFLSLTAPAHSRKPLFLKLKYWMKSDCIGSPARSKVHFWKK